MRKSRLNAALAGVMKLVKSSAEVEGCVRVCVGVLVINTCCTICRICVFFSLFFFFKCVRVSLEPLLVRGRDASRAPTGGQCLLEENDKKQDDVDLLLQPFMEKLLE